MSDILTTASKTICPSKFCMKFGSKAMFGTITERVGGERYTAQIICGFFNNNNIYTLQMKRGLDDEGVSWSIHEV